MENLPAKYTIILDKEQKRWFFGWWKFLTIFCVQSAHVIFNFPLNFSLS